MLRVAKIAISVVFSQIKCPLTFVAFYDNKIHYVYFLFSILFICNSPVLLVYRNFISAHFRRETSHICIDELKTVRPSKLDKLTDLAVKMFPHAASLLGY